MHIATPFYGNITGNSPSKANLRREIMAKLLDPDIDIVIVRGSTTPEPSIRSMIKHYYQSHGCSRMDADSLARELIEKHNEIIDDWVKRQNA